MTIKASFTLLWLLLSSSLSGCSFGVINAGADTRLIAVTEIGSDEAENLTLPAAATTGEAFDVKFETLASGCIETAEVEVFVDGQTLTITPYDIYSLPGENEACPLPFIVNDRSESVTLSEPGTYTVRLESRKVSRLFWEAFEEDGGELVYQQSEIVVSD